MDARFVAAMARRPAATLPPRQTADGQEVARGAVTMRIRNQRYSTPRNKQLILRPFLPQPAAAPMTITDKADFKAKVRAFMRQLQNDPEKIRSFYQKPSLKYAA